MYIQTLIIGVVSFNTLLHLEINNTCVGYAHSIVDNMWAPLVKITLLHNNSIHDTKTIYIGPKRPIKSWVEEQPQFPPQ